jgi:hypothetical protein
LVVKFFESPHVVLKKQTHERSVGRRFAIILWAECRKEHEV